MAYKGRQIRSANNISELRRYPSLHNMGATLKLRCEVTGESTHRRSASFLHVRSASRMVPALLCPENPPTECNHFEFCCFSFVWLDSRGFQDLAKTMKPSEKLTHVCGLRGGGCGVSFPGTGEQAPSPSCGNPELAMVPNALQRQSPDPAQASPGLVTQQGTFVLLFLSLPPHNGHCTSRKAPKLCPTRDNSLPWLERVCGLFSLVYHRGL